MKLAREDNLLEEGHLQIGELVAVGLLGSQESWGLSRVKSVDLKNSQFRKLKQKSNQTKKQQ